MVSTLLLTSPVTTQFLTMERHRKQREETDGDRGSEEKETHTKRVFSSL